jgi:dTDP-4-dehydrorhamnose reductase
LTRIKSELVLENALLRQQLAVLKQPCRVIEDLQAGRAVRLLADELRCPIRVASLAQALAELAYLDYTDVLHIAGEQALSQYDFGARKNVYAMSKM